MKFKVQSSKFENGRKKRVDLARALRTLNFELRSSRQRRASVLVLVMTLLGILFVLGVAFLATMNFEADMIVSETLRDRAESRVTAVVDQLGSTLRDGLMSDSRVPFGNPSLALSATAYAEMPGVQNSFTSVEPTWHPGPDYTWNTPDDLLVFSAYSDMEGLRRRPYAGPSLPQGFAIDTRLTNGGTAMMCLGGVNAGNFCAGQGPGACPGSTCDDGPPVLDADGDGIVDSIMVDARLLDFSDAQLAALSARLNPASMPTGNVYVGMRILPHGGLVNLNASHPKLIENVLDVPDLRFPAGPAYGDFKHRPTLFQVSYSPLLEEPSLRRRGLLPPRSMSPSWLHGDPSLDPATNPTGNADMAWQLFAPKDAANDVYETVFDHRYFAYTPTELFPGPPNAPPLWAVRMEPFTSLIVTPPALASQYPEYDRRHLVTTVSHDDLLARGGRVPNPAVPGGEEDILTKMTQANQTARPPGPCPALLPFEYVDYPETIPNECCPADYPCRLNARKGRLQLSLPYLDERIDEAQGLTDPMLRQDAFDRVYRLIHDTFFLLVRNAARVTTLEGTPCVKRCLAGTNQGKLCDSDAECPGSVCESVDCLYANGACGEGNRCTVFPTPPTAFNCASAADCSIPGSVCRADGVCTIQAPYWQDVSCATGCNTAAGEVCNMALDRCVDAWTGQTHSQALVSRTAASLTANFFDYVDLDDIPTRIAVRALDFTPGMCITGPNTGGACDIDADCGPSDLCSPPQNVCFTEKFRTPLDQAQGRTANFPIAPPIKCNTNADCSTGDYCAFGALQSAGREFALEGGAPSLLKPMYVYGLERQPYITEVATLTEAGAGGPPPPPSVLIARAVEIFNPYDTDIDATDQYYLYEVDPAAGIGGAHWASLSGLLKAGPKPFTTFGTGDPAPLSQLVGASPNGASVELTAGNALTFKNGWILYLVLRITYPGDVAPTNLVVDQFEVPLNGNVGNTDPVVPAGTYSRQRMVLANSFWTATVPKTGELLIGAANLGDWNTFAPAAPVPPPHPVEVNFANLGSFSKPFNFPGDPRDRSVSFPTTGSLLMLMRNANRSLSDYTPPSGPPVTELAFTTRLIGDTVIKDPVSGLPVATIKAEQQIDNGRMPVFDEPVLGGTNWYAAHHLSPSATQLGAPGNLDTLPWGQLVFDYFTALPLSNPGPYVDVEPGPAVVVALPDSKPRVDLDGLRVHGRININAAPWKVLAGLPFVPLERIPTLNQCAVPPCPVSFRDRIRSMLPVDPGTGLPYTDIQAGTLGEPLAQAIVAYRDLRPIGGTGDYATGIAADGVTPTPYARGWQSAAPTAPMARRGTGFMSVGELANVRHLGADTITTPPPVAPPKSYYRIDAGVMDVVPANNNSENFVDAVATLVALGDWVTVRSQVFTVYGVLRGEEDQTIFDPDPLNPPTRAELQARDADSRAMRFQETIDRLPTFLGQPMPSRIGDRTLTRYTDVRND